MKARTPATQKSIGTHNYPTPDEQAARQELNARHAAFRKAAEARNANPTAWKGWTLDGIARATTKNYTLDEDGFAWA